VRAELESLSAEIATDQDPGNIIRVVSAHLAIVADSRTSQERDICVQRHRACYPSEGIRLQHLLLCATHCRAHRSGRARPDPGDPRHALTLAAPRADVRMA
jgi:endonuclease/exonuclease/phosphatase family metal-dependent hydrolase